VTALVVGSAEVAGEEDPIYGGGGGGYAPLVRFRTRDGEVTARSSRIFSGNPHGVPGVGATVRVRYDPAKPSSIYIHGWDTSARVPIYVMVAAGVILTCVGTLLMVIAFIPY
jgi:hypothetical protein